MSLVLLVIVWYAGLLIVLAPIAWVVMTISRAVIRLLRSILVEVRALSDLK